MIVLLIFCLLHELVFTLNIFNDIIQNSEERRILMQDNKQKIYVAIDLKSFYASV